jgi:hypothetical protein
LGRPAPLFFVGLTIDFRLHAGVPLPHSKDAYPVGASV